jgi:hypothetical protein
MARFEAAGTNYGFDGTATPPWLMVGTGESKVVALVNGRDAVVRSDNRLIAAVDQDPSRINDERRELTILGRSPGPTFIDVFPPRWRVPRRLAVRVKAPKTLSLAFHYVKDDSLDETTRSLTPAYLDDLLLRLNWIYQPQANITFTKAGAGPVEVKTTLFRIVREQPDLDDVRDKGEVHRLTLAGDAGADINVFFMPWPWTKVRRTVQFVEKLAVGKLQGWSADRRPTQMFGTDRTCICEDSMSNEQLRVALPHMIGRLLRCPVIYNDEQSKHLMFAGRATGEPVLSPDWNRGFIPRDCSDRMNPG